ncbi:cytochrome c oxidase assembly protein [Aquabacter sp. L1I39]|uniref:cytochrome c oxidase assembly protein n=1 Tax=Aquabacter sp. L1I39 TaxID=2820278 RepID=UPI001ADC90B2|nr:cytochrome c oxidase assembly protein [Aquabacter sp. L1I39]QTL03256.1 cytochrome c oxidase assembly protein [Aquabacter sp. L1I39]
MDDIPYCGPAPVPEALWASWNLALWPILLSLAPLLAALCLPRMRKGPAALAGAALCVAFVSPLCALTVALFSARAVHHLVLVLIAAPALALAWPRALPGGWTVGFLGLSGMLWLWHLPAAYGLAWSSTPFYWLMQAGLVGAAVLFWSHVFHGAQAWERLSGAGVILAVAGQMGLIGAILAFAPRLIYPQHLGVTLPYGLDALADQQLAGLVMWVPGMVPLAVLSLLLLRRGWREAAQA